MLKERHRYGTSEVSASSRHRPCSNRRSGAVPEVGLIPGNRFLLLPLKKVTALVRPHTPCREPSATSTKPCITSHRRAQAASAVHHSGNNINFQARHRRRSHHRVAKAHLSPVSEHHEPLLQLDQLQGRPRTGRSRDTSIFTLSVEQAQLWRRSSEFYSSTADLQVRYRKPGGSRNINNRVAPNYYPDLRNWSSFNDHKVVPSSKFHGDLRSGGDHSKLVSRNSRRNDVSVAQHIRATSPFLCSFTNENDLLFGPSPLHRRSAH